MYLGTVLILFMEHIYWLQTQGLKKKKPKRQIMPNIKMPQILIARSSAKPVPCSHRANVCLLFSTSERHLCSHLDDSD